MNTKDANLFTQQEDSDNKLNEQIKSHPVLRTWPPNEVQHLIKKLEEIPNGKQRFLKDFEFKKY